MPQQDQILPPGADSKKAQKYIDTLVDLIGKDKITVTQTDLSRFNSSSMEDHYRINLHDYDAELSHNKNSDTGEETFILIFNSLSQFDASSSKPLILSYMHLTDEQHSKLKTVSDEQIERARKKEEEERFLKTMQPIDELLEQLNSGQTTISTPNSTINEIPEISQPEAKPEPQPEPQTPTLDTPSTEILPSPEPDIDDSSLPL